MCPCGRSCRRQCCQTSGSRGGSQSTQEQGAAAGNVLKGSRCGWSNGPHHVAAERFHHACWAPTEAQLTCSCQHLADYATVCNRQYVPQQRVPFTVSSSPTGPCPFHPNHPYPKLKPMHQQQPLPFPRPTSFVALLLGSPCALFLHGWLWLCGLHCPLMLSCSSILRPQSQRQRGRRPTGRYPRGPWRVPYQACCSCSRWQPLRTPQASCSTAARAHNSSRRQRWCGENVCQGRCVWGCGWWQRRPHASCSSHCCCSRRRGGQEAAAVEPAAEAVAELRWRCSWWGGAGRRGGGSAADG